MQTKERVSKRRVPLQVSLDPELRKKAELIAERHMISLSEVFRRALIAYKLDQN
jgi:hypothetical protein